MDLGTLMVSAVMVVACILPFALMAQNRKKRQAQQLFSLNKMAESQHCKIGEYEFCGDAVLGLSENENKLFYYRRGQEKEKRMIVNLTEIESCKSEQFVHKSTENTERIERLELVFLQKAKGTSNDVLEIYNASEQSSLSGELQLLEKWKNRINEIITQK